MSDVSIYFVWLTALLVVRDELEHLWRAISCCRLNRSPQVPHSNGSFARSATVILLLTVSHCGIRLLCRFKSCGRLNFCPHRSQDICKASLSTAVILRLFVSCSIVVVTISSASRLLALTFPNPSGCSVCVYVHTCMHAYIHTYIHSHQVCVHRSEHTVVVRQCIGTTPSAELDAIIPQRHQQ